MPMNSQITASRSPSAAAAPCEGRTVHTVTCRGLIVRYGSTLAVDEATFDAGAGEVLGLLGPNGAGKASLIRALTTMLPPAGGEARVADIDLRDPACIRSRIGVLPENAGYPADQTGIEYVRYHGRLYGIPGKLAHERGLRLLADMGLANRADNRIRTFSRGMKQRLGIARALINQPEVLFLDEPTLGLDPAGQEEVLRRIRGIATELGTTVILTSHLLEEINRICDRVVIMNKGRVVSSGSVDEVVAEAGVARSVRVRVPVAEVNTASSCLSAVPRVVAVQRDDSRPGEIRAEMTSDGATGANPVAAALVSAGVPLLSLELDGATLNDAFLRLTGGAEEVQR